MFYSEYLKIEAYEQAMFGEHEEKGGRQNKLFDLNPASRLKELRANLQFGPELPEPTQADYDASEARVKEMIAEFTKFHSLAKLARKPKQVKARRDLAALRGEPLFFDDPQLVEESLARLETMKAEAEDLIWPYDPARHGRRMPRGMLDGISLIILEIEERHVMLLDGRRLGKYPVVTLQRLKRAGLDLENAWHRDTRQAGGVWMAVYFYDIGKTRGIPLVTINFAGIEVDAYVYGERQTERFGYMPLYHRTKGMWDNYDDMS